MQELNVLWMDTGDEMNLDIFKCDTYCCFRSKVFNEKISPTIAKVKGKLSFLLI